MRLARLSKILILIVSAEILMGASGCPTNAPEFNWHPKIYVGDARTQTIIRKEGGKVEQISTANTQFDEMVCMHNSEPRKAQQAYFDVINQCQQWASPESAAAARMFPVVYEQEVQGLSHDQ